MLVFGGRYYNEDWVYSSDVYEISLNEDNINETSKTKIHNAKRLAGMGMIYISPFVLIFGGQLMMVTVIVFIHFIQVIINGVNHQSKYLSIVGFMQLC